MSGQPTGLIDRIVDFSCAVAMAGMVVIVVLQVTLRYIFLNPIGWSEEVGTMTMVWTTFIGSYLAFRDRKHMRIGLLMRYLSRKTQRLFILGGNLLMIVLNGFIFKLGMDFVLAFQTMTTPYLGLPQSWVYVIIPIATVLWTLQIAVDSIRIIREPVFEMAGGSEMSIGLVVLITLSFILLFAYVPLAFALGIATLGYMLVQDAPLAIIPQQLYKGADNFVLMALPLFILAGNLMNTGGITRRVISLSLAMVGHIRGGLALVNIMASMFFAGVSGSAVADTASLGAVLIPSMKKEGYSGSFSAAVTASSATIGIIIPPSIPMVIHGFVSGVSIGALFLAGVIPGILVGLYQMIVAYFISRKRGYPKHDAFSWKKLGLAFGESWLALLLPIIILVFITFGVTTPTEAGGIAVLYALIIGLFVYRELKIRDLYRILVDSARTTALIMIIISFSMILGWALAQQEVPQGIAKAVLGATSDPVAAMLLISFLLIVAGCFLHGTALQLILVPMLLPLVNRIGIDPLQFGMVVVLCVGIGQQTPPVGSALFVTSSLAEVDIIDVSRENLVFVGTILVVLLMVIFFPRISTWIPGIFSVM